MSDTAPAAAPPADLARAHKPPSSHRHGGPRPAYVEQQAPHLRHLGPPRATPPVPNLPPSSPYGEDRSLTSDVGPRFRTPLRAQRRRP